MTSAQPSPSSSRSPAAAPAIQDDEDFFASSPPANGIGSSAGRPTRSSAKRRASDVSQPGSPSGSAGSASPLFRGGGSDVEYENVDNDGDDDDDYKPGPSPKRQRRKASPASKGPSRRQQTPVNGNAIIVDSLDGEEEEEDVKDRSPIPPASLPPAPVDDWDRRFIGTFVISGYSLSRGANYIRQGDKVTLHRPPKAAPPSTSSASKSKRPPKQTKLVFGSSNKANSGQGNGKVTKGKEDTIIRFHNERGFEVGRIPKDLASWMSKLMDLDIAHFDGFVVDCPPSLVVGCDVLLELKAYLKRSAFPESLSASISFRNDGDVNGWGQETSETIDEKNLRERKSALMKMFRACTLKPSRTNDLLKSHRTNDDFDDEAMAAHFDSTPGSSPVKTFGSAATQQRQGKTSSPPKPSPMLASSGSAREPIDLAGGSSNGVAAAAAATIEAVEDDAAVPEENDGTEVTGNELDAVYSKAQQHDIELPEVEPKEGFALTLRAYQKQALGWMINMERRLDEGGGEDARELSLHPLWEEYQFPLDESDPAAATKLFEAASRTFYFNPYTGDMSLEFQKASRGARGGILADEMGLGKTIQMAALIASNQPTKEQAEAEARERSQSPQRERDARRGAKQMRQMSLATSFAVAQASSPSAGGGDRRKALLASSHVHGRVTLVVAPMSLISQWRDELERAVPHMTTMLYYAESKGDLIARLEGGSVDVVVTSFGTLVTEFKRYTDATTVGGGGGRSRHLAQVAPLFAVEWLRVILDEAHQIKNRVTRSAKACGELMAKRRWCLTGTPIVNRLSDLYSLLRFLRVEPWGDFSFFNSFVSKPFASKNPKALEVVQVILESILLRREKRTKDKDGKSIVELPKKMLEFVRLDFSPLERRVYEAVYRRAYTQYKSLEATGSVSKNFSFIFAVLMRLRQCVCHPLLVLKRKGLAIRKEQDEEGAEDDTGTALGEAEEEIQRLVAEYQAGYDGERGEDGAAQGPDPAHLEALRELLRSDDVEAECALCMEEKSETCYLPCKHSACRPCILEHIDRCEERDEEPFCPICRAGPFKAQDLVTAVSTKRKKVTDAAPGGWGEDGDEDDLPPSTQDSQPSIFLRRNDFRSSTKLEALARHLNQLRVEDPHFKAVIFSQFTSFLDLVEVVLRRDKHAFCRLDGTRSHKDRETVLKEFQASPKRMIILVSLRAGGVGLNLTAANHVWLLDCWWNAQIEDQAVDRIHRIGQTRPVHVHRYIINDSIEDRILAIQKRKTALVGAALAGTKGKDEKSEALQNLELLFAD